MTSADAPPGRPEPWSPGPRRIAGRSLPPVPPPSRLPREAGRERPPRAAAPERTLRPAGLERPVRASVRRPPVDGRGRPVAPRQPVAQPVRPRQPVGPRQPVDVRRPPASRPPASAPPEPGRLRRYVDRHGWRAYALPLLTVATLLTLIDFAVPGLRETASATAARTAGAPAGAPAGADPTVATGSAEGEGTPTGQVTATAAAGQYVEQGAGRLSVVPGASPVYGSGPLRRFVVEVEDGIDVDGAAFAQAVEATLSDPRSWGAGGRMSFQRVGADEATSGNYDFRVSLVSPGSMETYCPGVGTGGYTSCRYGERAVINLARWATAVPDYGGDVATYRQYVVNHEVGHALGHGHQHCGGAGQMAPVMQQQTLGLEGCTKNAWPYP